MSKTNQAQPAKVNSSKASVRSNASQRQPPMASNPLDVITRCGFGSRTEGKRSGLQPLDGDYVPSYDRIYKPTAAPASDTTRPAGIPSFPHLKVHQEMALQQDQAIAQQNQQHNVAEPTSPHTQEHHPNQNQQAQPHIQSGGDCPPAQAENHCAKVEPQVIEHQPPPNSQNVIPDPHEYVTKCPNCAATLVLTPQMVPCPPGHH